LCEQNVDAFIVSSGWPFPRTEHFRTFALARAIENQSYVIASNRVGKDDDLWFCGSSAIIDPRGVVIAAASADREELIYAGISQELVLSVRSRVDPSLIADRICTDDVARASGPPRRAGRSRYFLVMTPL
jgi:predicted amidohydrolase